jgi:hypothetical protein
MLRARAAAGAPELTGGGEVPIRPIPSNMQAGARDALEVTDGFA